MPLKDKNARNKYQRERYKNLCETDPSFRKGINAYYRKYFQTDEQRKYHRDYARARTRRIRGDQFGKWRNKMTPEQVKESARRAKAKYNATHREQVRDAAREHMRKFRLEHPERAKEISKRHYRKHKDRISAAEKMKRRKNPELYKQKSREYYQKHTEMFIHSQWIQRAKRGGTDWYLTIDDWLALLKEHNFRCFYCKVMLTKKTRSIDHKIPLARGGGNEKENLVPACLTCNHRKHTMTDSEFFAYRLVMNL